MNTVYTAVINRYSDGTCTVAFDTSCRDAFSTGNH